MERFFQTCIITILGLTVLTCIATFVVDQTSYPMENSAVKPDLSQQPHPDVICSIYNHKHHECLRHGCYYLPNTGLCVHLGNPTNDTNHY